MESLMRNAFVRSILVLIMGVGLVGYADLAPTLIVQGLGLLFLIPGLVTTIGAFVMKEKAALMLPSVVGTGSVIFGVILLLFPTLFIGILMYLLAVLLILAGAIQLLKWVDLSRKGMNVAWVYYLFPVVILIVGVFILSRPQEAASVPFQIMGYAAMVYALLELLMVMRSYFFLRSLKKKEEQTLLEQQEPEEVESNGEK